MKTAFYNISLEKQERILTACIDEFSGQNYNQCSLNAIIKKANISKGGLFKYISSKEELYLFTLEKVLTSLMAYQYKRISKDSTCYFDRIIELTNLAIDYYESNNKAYKVVLIGFLDRQASVYGSLMALRARLIKEHNFELLDGVNWDQYKIDKESLRFVVGCTMNGYNIELLENMSSKIPIHQFKEKMVKELGLLLKVMKEGVL